MNNQQQSVQVQVTSPVVEGGCMGCLVILALPFVAFVLWLIFGSQ